MRITGVEAAIAHYTGKLEQKRFAQSELRTNGERTTRGFTVIAFVIMLTRSSKRIFN